MKRGRSSNELTGGTLDVSPQWLTFGPFTLSAANTYTEEQVGIPVVRIPTRKGKAIVMEVLQCHFDMPEWDTNGAAGGTLASCSSQLSTSAGTAIRPGDPKVFAYAKVNWRAAFTAAGTYIDSTTSPQVVNTNDGAGHGILVATDNIFLGCSSLAFVAAATFQCRILYRFKEVSLEEYIGIVTSQQ
jgi:hypothetical protein